MPWPSAEVTVTECQPLPPRAIIAAAVVLPVAQASLTHCMVFGEQALPVRSELAVEDARNVIFVSRRSELIVRPTAEFGTSTMASTPSTSSHLRAIADPTSALFWWSA